MDHISHILPLPKISPITNSSDIKIFSSITDTLINEKIKKRIDEMLRLYYKKFQYSNYLVEDLVGELTGFDLIFTDENCGGYFSPHTKEIALKSGKSDHHMRTLSHEISHFIQHDLGIIETDKILSHTIRMEQQCETIAYYLYNGIMRDNPLKKSKFNHYFCSEDFKFLSDWYDGYYENDLDLI